MEGLFTSKLCFLGVFFFKSSRKLWLFPKENEICLLKVVVKVFLLIQTTHVYTNFFSSPPSTGPLHQPVTEFVFNVVLCLVLFFICVKIKTLGKKKKWFWRTQGQDRNKDTDIENGLEDTGRGKGKLGRSERVAWTHIHYQM